MLLSFKAVAALSSVALATLAQAVTIVPYGSSYIASNCTSDTVSVTVLGVCVCVDLLNIPLLAIDCSTCTASNTFSTPLCVGVSLGVDGVVSAGAGVCGCECYADSYAVSSLLGGNCYKIAGCTGDAGTITTDITGYSTCTCNTGYTFSNGACTLNASLRRKRSLKSVTAVEKNDAFYCPNSETACPIGSGYECIDTSTSLDSCGGCLTGGGVNCLAIPGSLGVSCVDSKCVVSSCFPGWSLVDGECIKN